MLYNYLIQSIHNYNPYINFNHSLYVKDAKNISGWHGNDPIFKKLISTIKPQNILEIGTWKGQSAINMGKIIKSLGLNSTLVCVDTWLGSVDFIGAENRLDIERDCLPTFGYPQVYYQFLANVIYHNLDDIIVPFPQTSSIALDWFNAHNIKFDLIYVDGSNNYEDVYMDIKNSWNALNKNGIIFGDDFNHSYFISIKKAVVDFCKLYDLNYNLDENKCFWWIDKK